MADLYYIETGYYDEGYFVYTAVADAAIDSQFNQSCDAEIIAGGGVIEANATFNSEGTTSIQVSKIANGMADFTASFTQSATISHIHGSDLFAFTEAAIAIQVDRIRDNNIASSSAFDVATDVERIQQGAADVDSILSAIIDGLRSRDTQIETQAAFSFGCVSDKIKLAEITLSVETSVVCDAIEITPYINAEAYINSEFSLVSDAGKIHSASISLETAFNLTAAITHIEGADLAAFTDAALSAQAERTRDNQSQANSAFDLQNSIDRIRNSDTISISSESNVSADFRVVRDAHLTSFGAVVLTANVGVIKQSSVDLTTQVSSTSLVGLLQDNSAAIVLSTTFVSRVQVLTRITTTTTFSGGGNNTAFIDTTKSKFGSGSLSFGITPGTSPINDAVWNGTDFKYIQAGTTWTSTDGLTWTAQSNNLSATLHNIIYTNGNYVSFGLYTSTIYYSNNGTTWNSASFSTTELSHSFDVIFYTGGYYHIYGTYVSSTSRIGAMRSTSLTGPWTRIEIENTGVSPGLYGGASISKINWNPTGYIVISYQADNIPVNINAGTYTTRILRLGAGNEGLTSRGATVYGPGSYNVGFYPNDAEFAQSKNEVATNVYSPASQTSFLRYSSNGGTNWTSNSNITNIQSIRHLNGKWMIATTGGLWTGTNISSLSFVNSSVQSEVSYGSGKWIAKSTTAGYLSYSTDSTTWQLDAIDPQPQPAYVRYSRGNNSDVASFKTLDFWIYHNQTNGRKLYFQDFNDYYIYFSIGNNYVEYLTKYGASQKVLRVDETNIVPNNTWTHIRISLENSLASLYVNGQRKAYITDNLGGTNASLYVGSSAWPNLYQETFNIDEILISDELITPTATLSFAVPQLPWYNESKEIDLLVHYDTNFNDDNIWNVNPRASIVSQLSITADAIKTAQAQSNQTSTITLSALGSVQAGADLEAFTNGSLTAQARVIKGLESSSSAAFNTTANVNVIGNTSLTINCSTSLNTDSQRIRFAAIATDSVSTLLSAALELAGLTAHLVCRAYTDRPYVDATYVDPDYVVSSDTIAQKITDITQNVSVEFNLTAIATTTAQFASLVMSAGTMSVAANKTTDIVSNNSITASQQTDARKDSVGAAQLQSNVTLFAQGEKDSEVALYVFNDVILDIQPTWYRITQANLSSQSTFYFDSSGALFQQAEADLTSTTNLQADNVRVRFAEIDTDAISINLTAAAKTTSADIEIQTTSSLTIDLDKIVGVSSNITATATQTAQARKFAGAFANIAGAMNFVVSAREFRIDEIEYRIPAEGWEYRISAETREYTLNGETRLRKITQETAIRKIASETRIYNIE